MIKLIIFDLDGTLVDAYDAIAASLNFTLRTLGYARRFNAAAVRKAVGWGDKNFIEQFVRPGDVSRALKIYREHHEVALTRYSRAIPRVKRLLAELKKRGYALAIASNRPRKFTMILITHLGLARYFDLVVCAKDKTQIKPHPYLLIKTAQKLNVKKDEALYAGDMAIDVYAGKNAGIKTIAVLGGSSTRPELKRARPFRILPRISDMVKVLDAAAA